MRRDSLIHRPAVRLAVFTATLATLLAIAAIAAERVAPQSSGAAKVPPPAAKPPALPDNAEEVEALQGPPPAGTIVTRRPPRVLTPMMAEIMAAMESRESALAAKRQQLAAVKADRAAAATLQREMQQMKMDMEIEVLRIQVRHAVKEGRAEDAQRIEASIEERLNPKVKITPERRPVPTSSTQR